MHFELSAVMTQMTMILMGRKKSCCHPLVTLVLSRIVGVEPFSFSTHAQTQMKHAKMFGPRQDVMARRDGKTCASRHNELSILWDLWFVDRNDSYLKRHWPASLILIGWRFEIRERRDETNGRGDSRQHHHPLHLSPRLKLHCKLNWTIKSCVMNRRPLGQQSINRKMTPTVICTLVLKEEWVQIHRGIIWHRK